MISDAQLRRALPDSAVRLLGDLIRWLAWALVFVVWAAFLQVYLRMIRLTLTDPSHSDFTIFYYTARLVRDGLPMYGVSPSRYGVTWAANHLGNLNPPHVQLLAMPLGYLTYSQALFAWVTVSLVCLLTSVTLIMRELRASWSRAVLVGALTISSAAFTTVAVTSEITFVLMLPLTLAWLAWRRERWIACGAWLGVSASAKLFLLLFVPWLIWRRRWDAVAAFAAAAAALVLVGIGLYGADAYRQWMETLGRIGWWWLTMNASWAGFVSRVLEGTTKLAPLVRDPGLVRPLATAGSAVIVIATLLASLRHSRRSPDAVFLLVFLGALLGSPLGWVYYLPLAYGPILAVVFQEVDSAEPRDRTWAALFAAGVLLLYVPHELTSMGQPSPFSTVTLASTYFWGVLLLWSAGLRRALA
jgi:hypothetical protein